MPFMFAGITLKCISITFNCDLIFIKYVKISRVYFQTLYFQFVGLQFVDLQLADLQLADLQLVHFQSTLMISFFVQ